MIQEEKLLEFLIQYIRPERNQIINQVLSNRTKYITVVLEDLYQAHNASAAIRTCDCFGIQNIHVVENKHQFSISRNVVRGSTKWVDIFNYNLEKDNSLQAIKHLKNEGYRIIATSPNSENSISMEQLQLEKGKIALVFGTEKQGISDVVKENADEFIYIPMYGFTESFNISVSVALCLQYYTSKLHVSNLSWKLPTAEKTSLKLDWVKKSLPHPEILEKEFLLSCS